jgi:hypothetical protein
VASVAVERGRGSDDELELPPTSCTSSSSSSSSVRSITPPELRGGALALSGQTGTAALGLRTPRFRLNDESRAIAPSEPSESSPTSYTGIASPDTVRGAVNVPVADDDEEDEEDDDDDDDDDDDEDEEDDDDDEEEDDAELEAAAARATPKSSSSSADKSIGSVAVPGPLVVLRMRSMSSGREIRIPRATR